MMGCKNAQRQFAYFIMSVMSMVFASRPPSYLFSSVIKMRLKYRRLYTTYRLHVEGFLFEGGGGKQETGEWYTAKSVPEMPIAQNAHRVLVEAADIPFCPRPVRREYRSAESRKYVNVFVFFFSFISGTCHRWNDYDIEHLLENDPLVNAQQEMLISTKPRLKMFNYLSVFKSGYFNLLSRLGGE